MQQHPLLCSVELIVFRISQLHNLIMFSLYFIFVSHTNWHAGVLDEVHDPIESPTGSHASSWIVTEMDPESSLDQDLKTARKLFGTAAVQMTQLGTEYWRVRLLVEMRHLTSRLI